MIGLKLVAWHYRHVGEPNKDARDLGPLLQATRYGPHGEALWDDVEALQRWEYQDYLVGPYRAGRQLHADWEPASLERLVDILDGDGSTTLASHISRATRETVGRARGATRRSPRRGSPAPDGRKQAPLSAPRGDPKDEVSRVLRESLLHAYCTRRRSHAATDV
ncbi:hypothetical protein ACX1DX_01200 [Tessaracoccus sp. Y36]